MNTTPHRDTLAVGSNNPTETAPTPSPDLAGATVAKLKHQARWPEPARVGRDRLRAAAKEAFPRSQQYRPAGDVRGFVGSGEA